jgi:hypothetical protein
MGHFAKVVDGIVVTVISAEPDFFDVFVDSSPGEWIQTSYNTWGNVHYAPDPTGADTHRTPDGGVALRGNYAGPGMVYDQVNDVFYPPQPFPSWTLSTSTWLWEPPTPKPDDGKLYNWDEATKTWVKVA